MAAEIQATVKTSKRQSKREGSEMTHGPTRAEKQQKHNYEHGNKQTKPAWKNEWKRDLTTEGIEPNPGPGPSRPTDNEAGLSKAEKNHVKNGTAPDPEPLKVKGPRAHCHKCAGNHQQQHCRIPTNAFDAESAAVKLCELPDAKKCPKHSHGKAPKKSSGTENTNKNAKNALLRMALKETEECKDGVDCRKPTHYHMAAFNYAALREAEKKESRPVDISPLVTPTDVQEDTKHAGGVEPTEPVKTEVKSTENVSVVSKKALRQAKKQEGIVLPFAARSSEEQQRLSQKEVDGEIDDAGPSAAPRRATTGPIVKAPTTYGGFHLELANTHRVMQNNNMETDLGDASTSAAPSDDEEEHEGIAPVQAVATRVPPHLPAVVQPVAPEDDADEEVILDESANPDNLKEYLGPALLTYREVELFVYNRDTSKRKTHGVLATVKNAVSDVADFVLNKTPTEQLRVRHQGAYGQELQATHTKGANGRLFTFGMRGRIEIDPERREVSELDRLKAACYRYSYKEFICVEMVDNLMQQANLAGIPAVIASTLQPNPSYPTTISALAKQSALCNRVYLDNAQRHANTILHVTNCRVILALRASAGAVAPKSPDFGETGGVWGTAQSSAPRSG